MVEKTVPTKYKLRTDTLSNFEDVNPILENKEPAIVIMPDGSYMMKVGNGSSSFNDLGYVSAIAADVPDWAKEGEKPTYEIDELDGLRDILNTIPKPTYVHEQTDPSSAWNIQHNLGKRCPSIVAIDSDGNRIFGQTNYYSDNLTIILFSAPLSGWAYLT